MGVLLTLLSQLVHEADMFRIRKLYENGLTSIIKIEGEISDENLPDWKNELTRLIKLSERQVILEIGYVTYMCPKAVEVLRKLLTKDIFLLNGQTSVRNMLHGAGLSANVLD